MDINILIGGSAGQGVDTIVHLLGKVLAREDYGVILTKDYMSRVRGGHNFSRLRVAQESPGTALEKIDILVALNEETYHIHINNLEENGRIIFDPASFSLPGGEKRGIPVKMEGLAREAGNIIMSNTVATGALLALVGLDISRARELLEETFSHKPGVIQQNITLLEAGYREASAYCSACFSLPPRHRLGKTIFLDGNQALGMAALASGCRFYSAYPMTPATGIMNYLAGKQSSHDLVVEQAEDEIAAINMVLGASYGGVRAMTGTSGGGFALMVEGLSLAGITEVPAVIVVAMRPGPATGLPTRTEQGDLEFALHGGHGEFPRAVLCATGLEDAFYRLNKAFQLADRYQVPVIFLSDQDFGDTARAVTPYDFSRLGYDRCLVEETGLEKPYRRYRLTPGGISPRALPGQFPGEVVLVDSDEHDEKGNIIEDGATRRLMVEKRMAKLEGLAGEMEEPLLYGSPEPEYLIIGWGSTLGVLRESLDLLAREGLKGALLHFSDLWPLPAARLDQLFPRAKKVFSVEINATGQFAALIRKETGWQVDHQILKYDGRPFMPGEIVQEVKKNV